MTSRAHGLALSLALGGASVAAAYAMIVTGNVAHGKTKPEVATDQAIAARSHKLDAWETSLRKALASKPPPVPTRARYAAVFLVSPPGALALPTPAAAPRQEAAAQPTTVVHRTTKHGQAHPKQLAPPKAPATTPTHRDDDTEKQTSAAPAPAVTTSPAAAPAVTPAAAPQAPVQAPAAPAPTPTVALSVREQCRILLRAAENQSESVKQAAEAQCEALKNAAGNND